MASMGARTCRRRRRPGSGRDDRDEDGHAGAEACTASGGISPTFTGFHGAAAAMDGIRTASPSDRLPVHHGGVRRPGRRCHGGRQEGVCTLTIGHIAALAGVSETTVRNAMREAQGLGLITVEERRLTAWRNAPNMVCIVSVEWRAWLRLGRSQGGGCKSVNPTATDSRTRASFAFKQSVARAAGGQPVQARPPLHGSERSDTR